MMRVALWRRANIRRTVGAEVPGLVRAPALDLLDAGVLPVGAARSKNEQRAEDRNADSLEHTSL